MTQEPEIKESNMIRYHNLTTNQKQENQNNELLATNTEKAIKSKFKDISKGFSAKLSSLLDSEELVQKSKFPNCNTFSDVLFELIANGGKANIRFHSPEEIADYAKVQGKLEAINSQYFADPKFLEEANLLLEKLNKQFGKNLAIKQTTNPYGSKTYEISSKYINSINGEGKDMVISIGGNKYSISDIITVDSNFQGKVIKPSSSSTFASDIKNFRLDGVVPEYVLGSEIIKDKEKLIPSEHIWEIEKLFGSFYKFIKQSGLFKIDKGGISISELMSYRTEDNIWDVNSLGRYGFVRLRAIDSSGQPLCIRFNQYTAELFAYDPSCAMVIPSL